MDLNISQLPQMHDMCRACLAKIEATSKLNAIQSGKDQPEAAATRHTSLLLPDLCRLFLSFTTLDVRYELEEFPKQLCEECADKLNEYEKFRERALASTRVLYLSLKKSADVGNVTGVPNVKAENISFGSDFHPNQICDIAMDVTGCNGDHEDENTNDHDNGDDSVDSEGAILKFDIDENANDNTPENEVEEDKQDNDVIESRDDNADMNSHSGSLVYDRRSESSNKCDQDAPAGGAIPKAGRKKEPKNPKLYCFLCKRQFPSELKYNAHMLKIHHGVDKPYQCDNCSKSYKAMGELVLHKAVYCGKTDIVVKDDIKYKAIKPCGRTSDEPGEFVCEICGKHLHSRTTLTYHMRRHQNNRKYECPTCGVAKINRHALNIHMRVHDESAEKFKCPQCPQLFRHKNAISRHIRAVHEGIRKHACSKCPKSFGTLSGKLLHESNTHGEGRDFICNICYRSFTMEETYKNHLKKHNKIQCNLCPNRYLNLKTLAEHQKVHLGDMANVCRFCSYGFYNMLELKAHIEETHGDSNCNDDDGKQDETQDTAEGPSEEKEVIQGNLKKSRKNAKKQKVFIQINEESNLKKSKKRKVKGEEDATEENNLSNTTQGKKKCSIMRENKQGCRSSTRISNTLK